ncbi:S8 family peptidase [Neptunomonas phycophila]|uniref:S8 family peptidase n=1 Tax=Neptunomonas phycophila TaxID=1572645 RepID=A0AAW7XJD3_9GAMM|nr:S8 family peptidase [Neptunomonas phycophila]MDO6454394.1 S8 family peptidase [Neptunomonas phycophila]
MSRHHLLLLPSPDSTSTARRGGGGGNNALPTPSRQIERLNPALSRLELAIDNRRLELRDSAQGVEPEYTLVLETIGTVAEFYNAAKRIPGLEWLGEYEIRNIQPDDDFYDSSNRDKPLNGQVMMMLSDRRAIDQLLSLWRRYGDDENMRFPSGLAKCKHLFRQLKDIRLWGVQDRLEHTGILEDWRFRLEDAADDEVIRFEAELWFRNDLNVRAQTEARLRELVGNLGGHFVSSCCIEGIRYHSALLELPIEQIHLILDDRSIELVKCDNVMLFRPLGQMTIEPLWDDTEEDYDSDSIPHDDDINEFEEVALAPDSRPVVALFDGLPVTNHRALLSRLIVDDPDDFESNYPVTNRVHGTAMASLICNGDLAVGGNVIATPLYVRPIFKPNSLLNLETIPDSVLPLDLIHRAVRRLFEGEGDEPAVAPTVKVINLSVGDPTVHFTSSISPFARLLDWLSHRYNVLFIVSAGNHAQDISVPGMTARDFRQLPDDHKARETIKAVQADTWNRKMLSPAESINSITVGAINSDSSVVPVAQMGGKYDIYLGEEMPAFYSAHGIGYGRSMKPDILVEGGRMLLNEPIASNAVLRPLNYKAIPGHKVPAPNDSGDLSYSVHIRGTSNSAALTSRACAQLWEVMVEIFNSNDKLNELNRYGAQLLKALTVHGASWGAMFERLSGYLELSDTRKLKLAMSQMLGYGKPDFDRAMYCLDNRATVLGYGALEHDEAHLFKLPIPEGLGGVDTWRRLTVTLAWMAKPCSEYIKYRDSALWFTVEGENELTSRPKSAYDWQMVRKGTLQHEVFEGENLVVLAQEDRTIHIKVSCKSDAMDIEEPVKYGLAITLEVADGTTVNLYQEVQQGIELQVQQRARTQVQV